MVSLEQFADELVRKVQEAILKDRLAPIVVRYAGGDAERWI